MPPKSTILKALAFALLAGACVEDKAEGDSSELVVKGANASFVLETGLIEEATLDEQRSVSCAQRNFEPELAPATLELVVDVSGSMSLPPPEGSKSKWNTTQEALREAVSSIDGIMSLGAVFYPNQATERNCLNEEGDCQIGNPVSSSQCVNLESLLTIDQLSGEGSHHRLLFESALKKVNPAGGTPTHDAYKLALEALESSTTPGARFVLLITDGQPTFLEGCAGSGRAEEPVTEEPIIAAILEARSLGILTFIIASPGSERNADTNEDVRAWLSAAAVAGGTASRNCQEEGPNFCHFDMSEGDEFGTALSVALTRVLDEVKSCSFPLPEVAAEIVLDLQAANVVLSSPKSESIVLAHSQDKRCTDGWFYGPENQSIRLCQNECKRIREDSSTKVELFFACKDTQVVPTR